MGCLGITASRVRVDFDVATYYRYATDFHDKYSHRYASRGNILSLLAFRVLLESIWIHRINSFL